MNPRVLQVKPGKNYLLELTFSNGETKSFDSNSKLVSW